MAVDPVPQPSPQQGKPCCCSRVMVWIDSHSVAIYVENQIQESRHLQVRADVGITFAPPPTPVSDSASDSELDTSTIKNQGKVYRIDSYTIHWRVESDAGVQAIGLQVSGEVQCANSCIPKKSSITLSCSKLLEPPHYQPSGPGFVSATVTLMDCAGQAASCTTQVSRP
jgi:hypothetical protein